MENDDAEFSLSMNVACADALTRLSRETGQTVGAVFCKALDLYDESVKAQRAGKFVGVGADPGAMESVFTGLGPGLDREIPEPSPAPASEPEPPCPAPPVVMPNRSAGVTMTRTDAFADSTRTTTATFWREDAGTPLDDLGEMAWRALNGDAPNEEAGSDGTAVGGDGPPFDGAHAASDVEGGRG